jgi:GT2 family glycosyltransferase
VRVALIYFTFNRIYYTKRTLPTLLGNTIYPDLKITIVDNASTDGTREYLEQFKNHPKIEKIVYNKKNLGLSIPTNQFWAETNADLVAKVDNDTSVPYGWIEPLIEACSKSTKLGPVGAFHFLDTDFKEQNIKRLLVNIDGINIITQPHIGGCSYIMRREIIQNVGPLKGTSVWGWTEWQHKARSKGYMIGYLWPLIRVQHLDDPRLNETDEDYLMITRGMTKRQLAAAYTADAGILLGGN